MSDVDTLCTNDISFTSAIRRVLRNFNTCAMNFPMTKIVKRKTQMMTSVTKKKTNKKTSAVIQTSFLMWNLHCEHGFVGELFKNHI